MWAFSASNLERVMGIEPTPSAWKAEVLPLNYTRSFTIMYNLLQSFFLSSTHHSNRVEGEGFEPSKAEPSDLQSDPFDRSGTPPKRLADNCDETPTKCQPFLPHKVKAT
jgi:hypothetical protein